MMHGISADTIQSFFALAWGLPIAGLCASAYQVAANHLPSFLANSKLVRWYDAFCRHPGSDVLRALHHHAEYAPRSAHRAPWRLEFVMVATVIAGLWSLMSGTVVVLALQALVERLISVT